MLAQGLAESQDYGYVKYYDQFADAAAFAENHTVGVWAQCGGFGLSPGDGPSSRADS